MNCKVILAANTSWFLYNFRLSLARYLRDRGCEVVLLSPSDRYSPFLVGEGFRWIDWHVGRQSVSVFSESRAISQTTQIYRQEQPSLVHHFTIKPVLYGTIAARMAHVPSVVNSITGRGYVFLGHDLKARLILPVVKRLYRQAYRHPNAATIFENHEDFEFFTCGGLIPRDRSVLIESVGVDEAYFSPSPEPDSGAQPLIVLPARLLWDKGVGTLVDAARLLKSRRDLRIALVGEPDPGNPAAVPVEQIRTWTDEGIVEYWGWIEDMRQVYHQCSIVTLPSFAEGVPKTLLEAAACGRPIVATDVPGCREVVIHGVSGLLVPPNDPPALAAALEQVAGDFQLRAQMGAAGRSLILEKFTQDRVNKDTVAVYERLLKIARER